MPCNMAMQDPETGVIRPESDRHVPICWEQGHVPTRRVVIVENAVGQVVGVVASVLLSQDRKVVAIEMHRVSNLKGF